MAARKPRQAGQDEVAEVSGAVVLPEPEPASTAAAEDSATVEAATVEAAPEPAAPPVTPPRARGWGGFVGLVAGGLIAAAAGFGLARYAVPEGWPLAATTKLEARLDEQAGLLATLQDEVARLEARPVVDPALEPRLAALDAGLREARAALEALPAGGGDPALEQRLAALETRLGDLELGSVATDGASAAAGFRAELAALKTEVEAQKAALAASIEAATEAARAQLAQAEAMAEAARVDSALGQVRAALDSGAAFAPALADLASAGQAVPAALSDTAESGVPTLLALQEAFPEAARAALDAALRADMGDGMAERMVSFLRTQTGARSLTPREGNDPDAVLSRVEAALRAGDLAAALAEAMALPPEGQQALAEWTALAVRRMQATQAFAALTADLARE